VKSFNHYSLEFSSSSFSKDLAITNEEKKVVHWIRRVAAGAALAVDRSMTQSEHNKRVEEYLKDHLQ